MEAVLQWVSTYGYAAIFTLLVLGIVGLPVPDEFLLVFSGYLVFSGRLSAAGAFAAALAGSTCGISCSYLLGRKLGLPLLHSKLGRYIHISDLHITRVHNWFQHAGHWTLFIGYYIPGVRHFTAIVAGTSGLEFGPFALYAYSGAFVWVSAFLLLGYHFGERWKTAIEIVDQNLKLAAFVAAFVLAVYVVVHYAVRRRKRRPLLSANSPRQ